MSKSDNETTCDICLSSDIQYDMAHQCIPPRLLGCNHSCSGIHTTRRCCGNLRAVSSCARCLCTRLHLYEKINDNELRRNIWRNIPVRWQVNEKKSWLMIQDDMQRGEVRNSLCLTRLYSALRFLHSQGGTRSWKTQVGFRIWHLESSCAVSLRIHRCLRVLRKRRGLVSALVTLTWNI